jgi:hypothetical protein
MGLKKHTVALANRFYTWITNIFSVRKLAKTNIYSVVRERGLEIIYLLFFFGFAAGIVNAILEGSKPQYIYAFVLSTRIAQTWGETIINFFVLILGTIGIYVMYQSGKQSVKKRISDLYVAIGLVLVLMAVLVGLGIMVGKMY